MSAYYLSLRYALPRAASAVDHNVLNNEINMSIETAKLSDYYATLKPNDAVALLGERLAAEADAFTRDTGLKIAAVKVKRDKESDEYRLEVYVRS